MKDHRFIELLNLYIDRQISAEETAELEAELQRNPKRQSVYQQYCKIHTATKLVYDSFRSGASEPAAVTPGRPGTVELFENRRRRTSWVPYVAGSMAAAACVAFVLMRQPSVPAGANLAATTPAPKAVVVPPPSTLTDSAQPVIAATAPANNPISLRNSAALSPDYSAMLVALREQDEERASAGSHWQANHAASLFDDQMFEAKPASISAQPRTPRARANGNQQVEMTVFQFQR